MTSKTSREMINNTKENQAECAVDFLCNHILKLSAIVLINNRRQYLSYLIVFFKGMCMHLQQNTLHLYYYKIFLLDVFSRKRKKKREKKIMYNTKSVKRKRSSKMYCIIFLLFSFIFCVCCFTFFSSFSSSSSSSYTQLHKALPSSRGVVIARAVLYIFFFRSYHFILFYLKHELDK